MTNNGWRLVLVRLHEQFTIGFKQDKYIELVTLNAIYSGVIYPNMIGPEQPVLNYWHPL